VAQAILPAERSQTIDAALARSVLYGVMTRVFQPPTDASMEGLTSNEGQQTFRDAAHLLDAEHVQALPLSSAVEELVQAASQRQLGDLLNDYSALFGHTARGLVCPYETEYGPIAAFAQPQTLADIAGSYRAFGLRRRSESNERVDHIGCECDFVMFLALKEAYALEALGDESATQLNAYQETLEETRKASRLFLRDHLGRFAQAFASTLVREDPHRFYAAVARLLGQLLDFDCERLGVPLGPPTLALRSEAEDETPMGCGDGEQLIQIQRRKP
jgi:TorA maturation chaperone TorD